jgi:hypothetical protein
MTINRLNAESKNINLHSKLYMLFVHNQKKKTKKLTRINIWNQTFFQGIETLWA